MPRKQKKYHYIYKTTNNVNGKYYYGMHSTDDLNDGYIGSGTRLWHSINYHGKENHSIEILEYLDDRESLRNREKELITEEMLKDLMCMNLVTGGNGGCTPESQRKRSISGGLALKKKLKEDLEFYENHREMASLRLKRLHKEGKVKALDWTGRKHTEESKRKMSESKKGTGKGSSNSQYGTCWINKEEYNKKIKKDQLDEYLSNGWIKGRKMK